jgi:PAS domain-containing protein
MNWLAVARLLAEVQTPCVVLDGAARVRLVNDAFGRLVDRRGHEIDGLPLDAVLRGASLTALVERVRSERACAGGCDVVVPDGREVELFVDGVQVEGAVVLAVWWSNEIDGASGEDGAFEYEVATSLTSFGRLLKLRTRDGLRRWFTDCAPRCHELLYRRSSPCDDCPALRGSEEVLRLPRTRENSYQLITVSRRDESLRVRVRRIAP